MRSLGHGDQHSQYCQPREDLGVWCITTSLRERGCLPSFFSEELCHLTLDGIHAFLVSLIEIHGRFLYTDSEVLRCGMFTEESDPSAC